MDYEAVKYTLHEHWDFEAHDTSLIDIEPFDPKSSSADRGPHGMVAEMESFLVENTGCRCFLDIGALSGIFSLIFSKIEGNVAFAFEPGPGAFADLVKNCDLNRDRLVVPINRFIGEETGREVACGFSGTQMVHGAGSHIVQEFEIDDFGLVPDIVKIDVEGYEGAVLRGAARTITAHKPVILLEVHLDNLACDDTPETLMGWLEHYDYRCFETGLADQPKRIRAFGLSGFPVERVVCKPI